MQVSCLPNFQRDLANRVFIDVMNEPDSMQISWEPNGNKPGAHQLYLGTADALWQLTPDMVMFMFEGARGHVCMHVWLYCSTLLRLTACWNSMSHNTTCSRARHIWVILLLLCRADTCMSCRDLTIAVPHFLLSCRHRYGAEHVWSQLG